MRNVSVALVVILSSVQPLDALPQTGGAIPTVGTLAGNAQAGEPMGLLNLLDVERIGNPRLAPDGRRILFTRTRGDWDRDRDVGHVWLVGIDGSGLRQMTNGATSESRPRWSPDGRRFAFVADRDADDGRGSQLWTMPIDGGEAQRITERETAIIDYAWAPDGDSIWLLAEESKSDQERMREEDSGGAVNFPRNWKHRHLFRIELASGAEEQVTFGDGSVTAFSLSESGDRVALTRAPSPLLDDLARVELWTFEVESDSYTRITDNDVPESAPALSPSGRWVAFAADALPRDGELDFYYESNLFVADAAGGARYVVAPELEGDLEQYAWLDDDSLLATYNLGVHSELFRLDLRVVDDESMQADVAQLTGQHDDPPTGSVEGFHLVPGRGLALRRAAPDNPGDLWYAVAEPFDARRVTDLHGPLRTRFALPRAEVVRWHGADGVTVEGILWHPLDAETPAPLVVQIHGGPASSVQLVFPGSWSTYVPVWTALGYAVLQPNYRGGVGYGDAFLRDMVGRYFNQAHTDVTSGVDALVASGQVDPERTAIMGWSAGGHMTNWMITHTDRFAAASSGAGAANWMSMYAQSDVRVYRTPWFGGTPWQEGAPLDAYLDNSPVFRTHRASTPTLILVGEQDVRVPMAQSIEMYRALVHSGVQTRLVTFPGQPHGLQRLRHRLHKMNVEIEWMEQHVRGREHEFARPPR